MNANVPAMALFILLCIAPAPAVALADLAVLTFDPPSGQVERTFAIENAVENAGTSPAGEFIIGFGLSSDPTFTLEDTLIGTRNVPSLAAGASTPLRSTSVTVPESVPDGWYYVGMMADLTGSITESIETNNIRVGTDPVYVGVLPDIEVASFLAIPGRQARTIAISSAAMNNGTGSTGPFTVAFYLSTDLTITTADTLIGTRAYTDLAAGTAGPNAWEDLAVPLSVPAGWYFAGMILDPGNAVVESDEGDNVVVDPAGVAVSDLPDLSVYTFAPPSGPVARTFQIYSGAMNHGATATGPFAVGFYLSADTTFTTDDVLIGTRTFADLAPFSAAPETSTTVTVPLAVPGGSYYVGEIFDPENAVVEALETNNVCFDLDRITIAGVPDIAISTFSPPFGPVRRTFSIQNRVVNVGDAPTGPFSVGFYLSSDPAITTTDLLVGTRDYTDLAAGAAGPSENTVVTVPLSVPAGSYYVGTIADPGDAVVERDEGNNATCDTDQVSIAAAPDIRPWNFSPPSGAVGRSFVIPNAVRNDGDASTGPFAVGFYLSADSTITAADTLIGTRNFADLAAFTLSPTENTAVTVPLWELAGTYYLGMIIDPDDAVAELTEMDNVLCGPDAITIGGVPDIAPIPFLPPSGPLGRTFTIQNKAVNFGDAPTGPFSVGFYLSVDSTITTADTLIGTRRYADIAPGSLAEYENSEVTIPASVPAGTYYLGAIADPGDAVAERDEENNAAYGPVPISIAAPTPSPEPLVLPVPPSTAPPTDPDRDGLYDDVNGNGRADFADVVLYFNQMGWISANEPVLAFDYNTNGRVDFADVVWLFNHP